MRLSTVRRTKTSLVDSINIVSLAHCPGKVNLLTVVILRNIRMTVTAGLSEVSNSSLCLVRAEAGMTRGELHCAVRPLPYIIHARYNTSSHASYYQE